MRRVLLLIGVALVCGCGGSGGSTGPVQGQSPGEEEVPERPPNILLIMADDLGMNDLSEFAGNPQMDTPNIDQLAAKSVTFRRHYANSVCSPARAALLSGQHAVRNNYSPSGLGLSPELITLPEALRTHGYSTWHIGKWHMGSALRAAWPDRQGFDHWFGFLNQWLLAGDPAVTAPRAGPAYRYVDPWLVQDGEEGRFYRGHLEDLLADKTLEVMGGLAEEGAPWFINLWLFAPHEPVTPSGEFRRRYADTAEGKLQALIAQMDSNIGRILDYLEDSGQAANTIVVLVSDNGGSNRRVDNNFPFFGKKTTFYEGGVRTPLIIRWPGQAQWRGDYDGAVTIYDLYPTLLSMAGLPGQVGLDGVDFSGAVLEGRSLHRDLYWSWLWEYAVRSADGRWLLVRAHDQYPELKTFLADLEADPAGREDVSDRYPDIVKQLESNYEQWHRKVREIALQQDLNPLGHGYLRGMDLLRTPGHGGFTLALGMDEGYSGDLAVQENVWSMSVDDAGEVAVRLAGHTLSGFLPAAVSSCHSIVVSGFFRSDVPGFAGLDPSFDMALYLDGKETARIGVPGQPAFEEFRHPTRIGQPDGTVRHRLHHPLVLSTALDYSPISAVELHHRVCAGDGAD